MNTCRLCMTKVFAYLVLYYFRALYVVIYCQRSAAATTLCFFSVTTVALNTYKIINATQGNSTQNLSYDGAHSVRITHAPKHSVVSPVSKVQIVKVAPGKPNCLLQCFNKSKLIQIHLSYPKWATLTGMGSQNTTTIRV